MRKLPFIHKLPRVDQRVILGVLIVIFSVIIAYKLSSGFWTLIITPMGFIIGAPFAWYITRVIVPLTSREKEAERGHTARYTAKTEAEAAYAKSPEGKAHAKMAKQLNEEEKNAMEVAKQASIKAAREAKAPCPNCLSRDYRSRYQCSSCNAVQCNKCSQSSWGSSSGVCGKCSAKKSLGAFN